MGFDSSFRPSMRRRSAERERLTTVCRRYARVFSGSRTRLRAEWTRMKASWTTSSQEAVSSRRRAARPSSER
jgi:hypothetical protein